MSRRVYGSAHNPLVDSFLYKCSETSAADALAAGRAKLIVDRDGRNALQLIEGAATDDVFAVMESVGLSANSLLQFVKTNNYGDKLHYEIPHAGDRSIFARHHRKLLHPSSRSYFRTQILPASS